jgi:hypothetical protein
MTKAAVVGAEHALVERALAKAGFTMDKLAPEIVVSIGGDGSALMAEHLYSTPTRAIRFDVSVDGRPVATDVIGDGVIVATPYGSTGYFRVITGRRFSKGLGIALNNSDKEVKYHFADENAEVQVRIDRGPALMCADNNTTMVPLQERDVVIVRKASGVARLIELVGEERKVVL